MPPAIFQYYGSLHSLLRSSRPTGLAAVDVGAVLADPTHPGTYMPSTTSDADPLFMNPAAGDYRNDTMTIVKVSVGKNGGKK